MDRKRLSLELHPDLIGKIDLLKSEWGLRSRGAALERLLQELLEADHAEESESEGGNPKPSDLIAGRQATAQTQLDMGSQNDFNETGALVLVERGQKGDLALDVEQFESGSRHGGINERSPRSQAIDLPGFVRKRTANLRQSLPSHSTFKGGTVEPLPTVSSECTERCFERARAHWVELYGTQPHDAVVEAAMVWLAKDIWLQSDQSDGRAFTWTLACSVVHGFAPCWPQGEPSFEAVIVMAGLLEDPFSASTLELRIPTLIRRFVHRFRKRNAGMSFQTLEHTMTLHGALKLLQLPTAPGHRLTLGQIREAYREMALKTHPDSGGCEEDMRKLNEAYQLLKELYRTS